ncbi:hypothetical protein RclHR1_00460020 [Rhizophagus clarus]|uniref:Uncharacterized protein n=1 Tax=Rhizophagus clarus TaxID=94130 RepID=A0A2Z6S0S5_9GLOM|nr:hypothetical protein RclHR1_00460020 [Rhizophagus clarus]GES73218.1 hypothetical protein RCL_jg2266.t1 [Rhizophagus clarus]
MALLTSLPLQVRHSGTYGQILLEETSNKLGENFEGFYKINILKKNNIENYKNCILLNAPGSTLDAFGIRPHQMVTLQV